VLKYFTASPEKGRQEDEKFFEPASAQGVHTKHWSVGAEKNKILVENNFWKNFHP
jgi:hypothetical protein